MRPKPQPWACKTTSEGGKPHAHGEAEKPSTRPRNATLETLTGGLRRCASREDTAAPRLDGARRDRALASVGRLGSDTYCYKYFG